MQIDLVATIDGEEVDSAEGISYEVGSGDLIEGIDEALESLTAGEVTTFSSTLLGGDHEGEDAEITVTVEAVKERELPEADDDFAQIASEFDTIAELPESLKEQVARSRPSARAPPRAPSSSRSWSSSSRSRFRGSSSKTRCTATSRARAASKTTSTAPRSPRPARSSSSSRSSSTPSPRANVAGQPGRADPVPDPGRRAVQHGAGGVRQGPRRERPDPRMVGEVARNKALAVALGKATVVDTDGKPSTSPASSPSRTRTHAEDEAVEEAEEIADAAAEADAVIEAEEAEAKPAKKAPATKKAAADTK